MVFKAKPKDNEKEILDKVLSKDSDKELITRMVEEQDENFPSISDISLEDKYVDPFALPQWFNTRGYAGAWIDPKDDIQRHRALDAGYYKIVNRMSACVIKSKIAERDFRDHGGVERQGMLLVYRPKDLDDKLRTVSVLRHGDMVESVQAGKQAEGYEISGYRTKDDNSKLDVVAYETENDKGERIMVTKA